VLRRPIGALVAAAIAVSAFAGASAAQAAPASTDPASLTRAATEARAEASAALAGLQLPNVSTARMRHADALSAPAPVLPLDSVIPVKVAAKHYDIHVRSTGAKSDRATITLYAGAQKEQVSVRRLVRVTVIRHGYKHPLLETTTTFKRFVVMLEGLQSTPLIGKSIHFTTRSGFVAAISHGLAADGAEVNRQYGSLVRFVQMALDMSATLMQAVDYAEKHPTATDFSAVPAVHTTLGSGAYAGTVTLAGTIASGVPTAFQVAVTNTTDASALSVSFDAHGFTFSATVDGKTTTQSIDLRVPVS
jgi:hypothetical protein